MTKENFIEIANKTHNNQYDYSKVDYKGSKVKVCIICPIHGEFWQTPSNHLRGRKCPKCANMSRGRFLKLTTEEFIKRAKEIHGNKYDYSKVNYINSTTNVEINCKEHGSFFMTPLAHLYQKQGCPKCIGRNFNTEEIINKFKEIHGNKYDYSKVIYNKMHEKVCIICKEHGEFWQTPSKHLLGQGCPKCAIIKRSNEKILTTEEFIEKAKQVHGDKYDYSKTIYIGTYNDITIICKKHGEFIQRANDHLNGHGCQHCGVIISKFEDEINEFILSLGINTIRNDRTKLDNHQEIDIFIPLLNIGIECDGLVWHSDMFKDKNYHIEKTNLANNNGIRLIHIFEDEWNNKKEIVKNILLSIFKINQPKIYARKCLIKELKNNEIKEFVNSNHIQGHINGKYNLGLFFNNELVSVMSFGSRRINLGCKEKNKDEYELLRYCVKDNLTIIGGAKKLFSFFIKTYSPKKIVSYCDIRYFNGDLYYNLGFELKNSSKPNYYYIIGNNRNNRFKFRKSELVKQGFDKNKTESEIMKERIIPKIYDCGNYVFEYAQKN